MYGTRQQRPANGLRQAAASLRIIGDNKRATKIHGGREHSGTVIFPHNTTLCESFDGLPLLTQNDFVHHKHRGGRGRAISHVVRVLRSSTRMLHDCANPPCTAGHERGSDSLAHHRSAHATPTYHRERSAYDEHEHAHGHHHSAMQLSRPRETTVRFSDEDDGMEIYALGRNRSAIPYDGRGSGSTTRHQAPAMGGRSHASAMRMGDNDDGTLRRYRSAMPLMSRGGGYQQVSEHDKT